MCGRYTNTRGPGELSAHFGVPVSGDGGTRRYNIAPTQQVLAIVAPDGEPEARLLRWGLVPSYATDIQSSYKMINARMETVTTKAAYRRLIPRAARRALQVADGYYEWLKPERRGEPRQPFYFQVDDDVPFAFAALWTPAKLNGGEWAHSIALLTCDPDGNAVARAIHDRMPVILADAEARRAWLDPSVGTDDALALCAPLAAGRLSARPVNPAVNRVDPEHDGPELLQAPAR